MFEFLILNIIVVRLTLNFSNVYALQFADQIRHVLC